MRPLIVGEVNPYGSDPAYALFPLPEGASGYRLRKILGMSDREYLRAFDRANLCTGRWSAEAARAEAERIRQEDRPAVVLLGRKVAAAFGYADHVPFSRIGRFVLLPHPSGRCHAWNDPSSPGRARELIRGAVLDGRKDGVCCACGYDGEEETPCPKREDGTHCEHWWDGPA